MAQLGRGGIVYLRAHPGIAQFRLFFYLSCVPNTCTSYEILNDLEVFASKTGATQPKIEPPHHQFEYSTWLSHPEWRTNPFDFHERLPSFLDERSKIPHGSPAQKV